MIAGLLPAVMTKEFTLEPTYTALARLLALRAVGIEIATLRLRLKASPNRGNN